MTWLQISTLFLNLFFFCSEDPHGLSLYQMCINMHYVYVELSRERERESESLTSVYHVHRFRLFYLFVPMLFAMLLTMIISIVYFLLSFLLVGGTIRAKYLSLPECLDSLRSTNNDIRSFLFHTQFSGTFRRPVNSSIEDNAFWQCVRTIGIV